MGYSFLLAARVSFYASSHRQDTMPFVTPVVEHWLEWEIAQWVHPMKDWSDDPSHHERMLLPQSYISLPPVLQSYPLLLWEWVSHEVVAVVFCIIIRVACNQSYHLFLCCVMSISFLLNQNYHSNLVFIQLVLMLCYEYILFTKSELSQ